MFGDIWKIVVLNKERKLMGWKKTEEQIEFNRKDSMREILNRQSFLTKSIELKKWGSRQ